MSHPRVGVVDPVDRHLVDAQAAALGEHQQLGVEEPAVVAHLSSRPSSDVAANGLEAALGVGEARPQRRVQQAVVGARDELAVRPAHDARAVRQARPDREVGVPGEQRRDQRQQPAQVGREVDVHVADHAGVAGRPCRPQRAAAPLALQPQQLDAGQLVAQPRGDRRRRVRGPVVGDDDAPREREAGRKEAVQAPDAALERGLLVVDGDDDVDLGAGGRGSGTWGELQARPRGSSVGGG